MLTIHNVPPGMGYTNTFGGIATSTASHAYYFLDWFGPYSPNGAPVLSETTHEILGSITNGKWTNAVGDTSCFHQNFDGDISVVPFIDSWIPVSPASTYIHPRYKAKVGISTYDISHIVPENTDEIYTYDFDKQSFPLLTGEGYGFIKHRCYNVGGVVATGVFTDNTYWDARRLPYKWVHIVTGTISVCRFNSTRTLRSGVTTKTFTTLNEWESFDPGTIALSTFTSGITKRIFNSPGYGSTPTALQNISQDYLLGMMPTRYVPEDIYAIGDLAQRCVDQQDYVDVNTLGFINELRDVGKLIPKLSGLKNPKTYASLYLWFKYGFSLTVSDSKKLAEAVENVHTVAKAARPQTTYASQSNIVVDKKRSFRDTYRYKLTYEPWPSDLMNFIGKARKWNFWPKLATAWDMIPLSFVVDWAIDVQSLLHRLDTRTDVEYFNTLGTCWSRKIECDIPGSEFFKLPVFGAIHFTSYTRRAERFIRLPRLRLDQPQQFHNYAELTALIVTRR